MTSSVLKKIGVIQSFTDMAPTEVTEAFQLPSPLNIAQSILIGESPPFKRMLLRRLELLGDIEVYQVFEKLQTLLEHVRSLQVAAAQESLRKYVIRANTHLDTLDKFFVAHRRPPALFVGEGLQGMESPQSIGIPAMQDEQPAMGNLPTFPNSRAPLRRLLSEQDVSPTEAIVDQATDRYTEATDKLPGPAAIPGSPLAQLQQQWQQHAPMNIRVAQPGTACLAPLCMEIELIVSTPDTSDTVTPRAELIEEQISAAIERQTSPTWPSDLKFGVRDSVDEAFLNLSPQGEGL